MFHTFNNQRNENLKLCDEETDSIRSEWYGTCWGEWGEVVTSEASDKNSLATGNFHIL